MQNHSVAIVRPASGEVVFNSSVLTTEAEAIDSEAGTGHLRTAAVRTSEWEVYQESAASGCAEHQSSAKGPIEQLHLTGGGTAVDEFYSDYLWYTTTIPAADKGSYTVKSSGAGGTVLCVQLCTSFLIGRLSC